MTKKERELRNERGSRRGRPKQLTHESIVRAAARFKQSDLNLGDLARSLGVTPQSLYHYFPSIKAIDDAVSEFVGGSVEAPDAELPWRDYLRRTIYLYREWTLDTEFAAGRGYRSQGISAFRVGDRTNEALLGRLDAFLGVFVRDGFEFGEAVQVWIKVQNFCRRSDLHGLTQEGLLRSFEELRLDIGQDNEGQFPNLRAVMSMECPDADELYEMVVDSMVAGIESRFGAK